jgi:hypothetical protein
MNRGEHMLVDEMLLGYTDENVHAFIDQAAAWLGFGHRSMRHTVDTVEYVEQMKGREAGRIALLHILVDNRVMDHDYLNRAIAKEKA